MMMKIPYEKVVTAVFAVLLFSGVYFSYQAFVYENHQNLLNNEAQVLSTEFNSVFYSQTPELVNYLTREESIRYYLKGDIISDSDIKIILETVQESLNNEIAYVMDVDGDVVLSSTYGTDEEESLLGNNYKFRPYFYEAMVGESVVYPAVGVTTNVRGIYFSSPIVVNNDIVGVAVIKKGLSKLDELLEESQFEVVLVSPKGVIFATNTDNLYEVIYDLSDAELEMIRESKQFADNTLLEDVWEFDKHDLIIGQNEYSYKKVPLSVAGWSLIVYDNSFDNELTPYQILVLFGTGFVSIIIVVILYLIIFRGFNSKNDKKKL